MLLQNIVDLSVFISLISPLIVAIIIGLSYFFEAPQEFFEKSSFRIVRIAGFLSFFAASLALILWLFCPEKAASIDMAAFHIDEKFSIHFDLFYDIFGLIFLFTIAFVSAIITFFSHRYLHRDPGYRRFFTVISLFVFGMNLIVLAGTFDLIFAGWEIVGISSYLLIAYFWHRPKAVAAATRAYYLYRVSDLGFLVGIIITHFFWHDVSLFHEMATNSGNPVLSHLSIAWRWLLSICILLPVLAKSAQFPFSYWLPKAMEGPTHSSAIFYGSLSIHVGIFLLIRTMPIWYFTPGFTIVLGIIGLITAVSATLCALVQATIKGQIGYASIAQVGIMLIELAFGFKSLVFAHLIGNAFLRCFQLLVSSSILTTHLQMQQVVRSFGELNRYSLPQIFPSFLQPSLYVYAINDAFSESIIQKIIVTPLWTLARGVNQLINKSSQSLVSGFFRFTISVGRASINQRSEMRSFSPLLAILLATLCLDFLLHNFALVRIFSLFAALILALAALGEERKAVRALSLAIFGNLFAFLSLSSNHSGRLYLIGFIVSAFVALEALSYIEKRRNIPELTRFLGLYQQFPLAGTMLLIGMLGMLSFPISSTFYGEDLLLSLTVESGLHYLISFQVIFIFNGIAIIRLFSNIMLGKRANVIEGLSLDMSRAQAFLRATIFFAGNIAAFYLAVS
jgi:NADH-quinone oxidoreductase subunit L